MNQYKTKHMPKINFPVIIYLLSTYTITQMYNLVVLPTFVFYLSTVSTGIMLQPSSPRPAHTWGVRLSLTILSCLLTTILRDWSWECRTTVAISCRDRMLLAFTEPNSTIRSSAQMPWNSWVEHNWKQKGESLLFFSLVRPTLFPDE